MLPLEALPDDNTSLFNANYMSASASAEPTEASITKRLTSDGLPYPIWVQRVIRQIPLGPTMHAVFRIPRSGGRAPMTLFVGDLAAANDGALLRTSRITHIVNTCAGTCGSTPAEFTPFGVEFTYGVIFTNDHFAAGKESELELPGSIVQNPAAQWYAALLVLRDAYENDGGNVLIHCAWGINRSSTTAGIFLTAAGLAPSFDAAIATMRVVRAQISPQAQYRAWALDFLRILEAGGGKRRFSLPDVPASQAPKAQLG